MASDDGFGEDLGLPRYVIDEMKGLSEAERNQILDMSLEGELCKMPLRNPGAALTQHVNQGKESSAARRERRKLAKLKKEQEEREKASGKKAAK
eukprot:1286506-Rhodomonas_salina.1